MRCGGTPGECKACACSPGRGSPHVLRRRQTAGRRSRSLTVCLVRVSPKAVESGGRGGGGRLCGHPCRRGIRIAIWAPHGSRDSVGGPLFRRPTAIRRDIRGKGDPGSVGDETSSAKCFPRSPGCTFVEGRRASGGLPSSGCAARTLIEALSPGTRTGGAHRVPVYARLLGRSSGTSFGQRPPETAGATKASGSCVRATRARCAERARRSRHTY
jgi:hypothetical protein